MVIDGLQPKSNPTITAAQASAGYDYTKVGWWEANKAVTLTDNTTIPANTKMTTAQMRSIKVTEDITLKVTLDPIVYTLSYDLASGSVASDNPTSYTIETPSFTLVNPARTGYSFAGWTGTELTGATTAVSIAQGSTGNRSFTATWQANTYTLAFDKNAADATDGTTTSKSVTFDQPVGDLPAVGNGAPTRAGYTFSGWATTAGATTSDFNATTTWIQPQNNTVYALWTANAGTAYTTEHYKVGSSGTATLYDTENLTGTTDTQATATVRTIIGYTHDSAFTGTLLSGNITGDGSLVLKVYYKANSYTVAFDANGGTGAPATITVAFDETLSIPSDLPTRAGYNFVAWNTVQAGGGTGYNAGATSTWTTDENITLYAQWTAASGTAYTVEHYQVSSAGTLKALTEELSGTTGTTATLTPQSFAGYTHVPTYTGSMLTGTIAGDGSLVLRAYYQINTFTVDFKDADGTVLKTETVEYDADATAPANPVRTGYDFTGWDKAYTNITQTTTVNATYALKTFTVTFVGHDDAELAVRTVTYGSAALAPTAPIRTGYTFSTWDTPFSSVTENLTVKAIYTANTYTLAFDKNANDATEGTLSKSVTFDQPVGALPAPGSGAPTRAGYTFTGWASTPGATTTDVSATDIWTQASNDTVYAIWAANTNTAYTTEHYKVNSGGIATRVDELTETLTGTTDTQATATPKTITGHTHVPTHTDSKLTGTIAGDGSLVLKVYYQANTYQVSYLPGTGGQGTMAATPVTFGESVVLRDNSGQEFTRQGYTFTGWNTQADGSGTPYAKAATVGPWDQEAGLTLHATWIANTDTPYTVEHYMVSSAGTRLETVETFAAQTDASVSAADKPFIGYSYAPGYPGEVKGGTVAGNGSLVLKLYYQINVYPVTVVDYNGNVVSTQQVEHGGNASVPADPARPGYTFNGWSRSFNNITGPVTISPVYTILSFPVTFVDWNGTVLAQRTVNYGSAALAPVAPVRTGYTFTGWSTAFNYITSALTVTAQYEALPTYTVSYNGNGNTGGSAPTDTNSYLSGNNATVLGAGSLIRTGHSFLGWATSANGDVVYRAGDALAITASVTLYAVWESETTFTPISNTDSGTGTTNNSGTGTTNNSGTGTTGNSDPSTMNIAGNDVPLFGGTNFASWSLFDLIAALLSALALLISALRFVFGRKGGADEEEKVINSRYNKETDAYDYLEKLAHRRTSIFIISVVVTVVAAVLFFLTQDINQTMVLFDIWSIAFAAIVIVSIAAAILVIYKREEKTSFDENDVLRIMNAQTVDVPQAI